MTLLQTYFLVFDQSFILLDGEARTTKILKLQTSDAHTAVQHQESSITIEDDAPRLCKSVDHKLARPPGGKLRDLVAWLQDGVARREGRSCP